MKITELEVRAIEWMNKHLPTELLQEMCWPSSLVWPSVIVQQDNTGTYYPAPFVLNGPSQFLQCFAVTLSIHRLTSAQDIDEENAPSVPEHRANHFLCRQSLHEFHLAGRSTVTPMHWLPFGFWGNVCNPRFIMCNYPIRSDPETSWSAAEMSMLTPCAFLCVLVSVSMLCAFKTLSQTILYSRRELE